MGSTKEGTIQQLGQARGMKKALSKMVEDMLKVTKKLREPCACHFPLQLSGTCTVCEGHN